MLDAKKCSNLAERSQFELSRTLEALREDGGIRLARPIETRAGPAFALGDLPT